MKTKTKSTLLILLVATVTLTPIGLGVFFHNNVVFRGTITYLSFEGGFYGITSDAGDHYDPINLPQEFWVDGLQVYVIARRNLQMMSFHMWGEIIEIRYIRLL